MKSKPKVPQYAIAEKLGLSRSTVSKVFANRQDVSVETRDRVLQLANKLGYSHHRENREPPTKAGPRVGVLVRRGLETPSNYIADYLYSLSEAAMHAEATLVLHYVPATISERDFFQKTELHPVAMRNSNLDALLLAGPWTEQGLGLAAQLLPTTAITFGSQHADIDTVEPDTFGAVRAVVEHLSEFGHQKVAFVGLCPEMHWSVERFGGFVAAAFVNGLEFEPDQVIHVEAELLCDQLQDDAWKSCLAHISRLITTCQVTALVCSSDWAAFYVYKGLAALGFKVPRDVSLIGFDDAEIVSMGCPPITSVHVPRDTLAQLAISRIARRFHDSSIPLKRSLYPCQLVDNGTTAAVGELQIKS